MAFDRRYRSAVRILGKPTARLLVTLEAERLADNAMRDVVRAELEAGADPRALYEAASNTRRDDEHPDAKRRRVILVGVLRRGAVALHHT